MMNSKKVIPTLSLAALLVSSALHAETSPEKTDVLLIGGGIMSASMGTMLVDKLDGVAL